MGSANDGLIDSFQELIWGPLVEAAIQRLFASIPWLGWGPLGWLISFAITKFAKIVYVGLTTFLDLQVIAIRNDSQNKKYTRDSIKLYSLAKEYGVNSSEYQEFKDEARKSFQKHIQYGVAQS